ncbi:MAG: hypothetical protein ACKO54_16750, partial [Alphaproteobacteria bacterium]
ETRTQPILRTALEHGGIFSGFAQLAKGIGLILKARQSGMRVITGGEAFARGRQPAGARAAL